MLKIKKLIISLIRPSNYDDDGFIIQYYKGVLPSNTLACMRSLTLAFAGKWENKYGLKIKVESYDNLVQNIPYKKLAAKNTGTTKVVAALVGVQSNQFIRASDIAKKLSSLGVKTVIGGFHVSGILAMFKEPTPEIKSLMDSGVIIAQGEAEDIWESIVLDIVNGNEKKLYRTETFPNISDAPTPYPDNSYMKMFALPNMGTIDCSRGCPFNCSFCTVVTVQGHKMRHRSASSVISAIKHNWGDGITRYFFTDDNFSRNPDWEIIFDSIIEMRNNGIYKKFSFMMQVDTTCNKIPGFIEKASQAGCTQVFIGMESINSQNLTSANKKQNKVENYASFINDWHNKGIMTHVGYIIGFPFDTPQSVAEDIDRLKNEIKVDQVSFFILTPLPGSVDHYNMVVSGEYMDPDLNNYDSFHVVTKHPRMTEKELYDTYQMAWDSFYDFDNLKRILIRAGNKEYWNIFKNVMWYKNSLLEPRHPMVAGFIRKKNRTDVRSGTPVKGFFEFYKMRIKELTDGFKKRVWLFLRLQELWLATRKPEDPSFKLVADFTATIHDMRRKLASIDLNASYTKRSEEFNAAVSNFKQKLAAFRNPNFLSNKRKKKFNTVIDDINSNIEIIDEKNDSLTTIQTVTSNFSKYIKHAEESICKNLERRRKTNAFWNITFKRISEGKVFRFIFSIPKIIYSFYRDIKLSISFAIHFKKKNF